MAFYCIFCIAVTFFRNFCYCFVWHLIVQDYPIIIRYLGELDYKYLLMILKQHLADIFFGFCWLYTVLVENEVIQNLFYIVEYINVIFFTSIFKMLAILNILLFSPYLNENQQNDIGRVNLKSHLKYKKDTRGCNG